MHHTQHCEDACILLTAAIVILVGAVAWAMTAWVRMLRSMSRARGDWEYAAKVYDDAVNERHAP